LLIDWFTVLAQAVNFLILVVLLKFLLYDRIIKAVDAREKRIQNRLDEADEALTSTQATRNELKNKIEALEKERVEILDKAAAQAEIKEQKLLDQAREKAARLEENLADAAIRQHKALMGDLASLTARQIMAAAASLLHDLADHELQDKILEVFLARIRTLSAEEKAKLAQNNEPVIVASALSLSDDTRHRLKKSLEQILETSGEIRFRHDPELIMGLELLSHGTIVDWNIKSCLHRIREKTEHLIQKSLVHPAGEKQDNA
jgi:F-type H+-transporting ATPase subunit b